MSQGWKVNDSVSASSQAAEHQRDSGRRGFFEHHAHRFDRSRIHPIRFTGAE